MATFKDYLKYEDNGEYSEKQLKIMDKITLSNETIKKINSIDKEINILVVAQVYCPDCRAIIPFIEKFSELNNKIKVIYSSRDESSELLKSKTGFTKIPTLFYNDKEKLNLFLMEFPNVVNLAFSKEPNNYDEIKYNFRIGKFNKEIENIKIFSVEIQEKIYKHLVENIKNNNLENKIYPLNKDIKEVEGEYDIIFSNPPYRKIDSGKLPEDQSELISKYEKFLTLEELFLNIKRLLKNNGYFFVIVPNYRLNDIFSYIYKNNMTILSLEINEYKKNKLVVVHGKKGGKSNSNIDIEIIKK